MPNTYNNQTFPNRPTLEQSFALNEEVPTAKSPTAMEIVPNAESPVRNEDIPTDESLTEVVGVPTAKSPTLRKFCDERAIHRNARNLLVTSVNMANEGDESQVNSLSPSNIDIQTSIRVTFSIDPGNEGSQSSTSVPSEGEGLGKVVDVDPTNQ